EEHKQLADIERLLKRSIPREPLRFGPTEVDLPAGSSGSRPRDRHRAERRGDRHATSRPRAPAPAATVAADGFDFSKPYEPASDSRPRAPAAEPEAAPKRRPARETAVLLGGSRSK